MKILVVDDNATNRKYLRVLLMQEGHTVFEGEDGLEALHILERQNIDAVISDILMPRMDGYRLCYEIRSSKAMCAIPLILYTATYNSDADEKAALDFGADKFIVKPALPEVIIRSLHEVMDNARERRMSQLKQPEALSAMREYSEILVKKLEEQQIELEAERARLSLVNEELVRRDEQYRLLLNSTAEAIYGIDLQGNCTLYNSAFLRLLGYQNTSEILGKNMHLLIHHTRLDKTPYPVEDCRIYQAFRKGEGTHVDDEVLWRADGTSFPAEYWSYPIRRANEVIGSVVTFLDTTERRRAEQETQRNLRRIRALHEIDVAIGSTLDLNAVLQVLLEKIEVFLPFPAATTIRLFNPVTGRFANTACRNMNAEEWKAHTGQGTGEISSRILKIDGPVVIQNIQTDTQRKTSGYFLKYGFTSYLGVPLKAKNEVVGILGLHTKTAHEFTEQEIELLLTLGGQAAIAIHNAQLYEHTKKQEANLLEQERIQRILKELSQDITKMDADALLEKLTTTIRAVFKVDVSDVRFVAGKKWANVTVASEDMIQRLPEGSELRVGATDWVVRNRKPIAIHDYLAQKEFTPGRVTHMFSVRGFLATPLLSRSGDVMGVMRALCKKPRTFTAQEIDLFEQLANGAAVAIENERLYRDLEKSNKVKSEFLSVMSHELRTPLNVILGYSALGRGKTLNTPADERQTWFHTIESQAKNLLGMVNSIMAATQIEARTVAVAQQPVDVGDLFEQLSSSYDFPKQKSVPLIWQPADGLPRLVTDSEKLQVILRNLISNALKFTERGKVTVSAKLADASERSARRSNSDSDLKIHGSHGSIEFEVSDTGLGIPEESLSAIFDLFKQVDGSTTRAHEGVGLGLYIAKKYCELLGGEISVESKLEKGSAFTVRIPCDVTPPMRGLR